MEQRAEGSAIVWLGEPASAVSSLVGPKTAHLGALSAKRPVPPGFCVTAEAYRAARRAGGLTEELAGAIRDAYSRFTGRRAEDAYVAVRSSAIDEDGAATSFAGLHDTVLNVRGADAVLAAIERTWESLHSDSARAYRSQRGITAPDLGLAVLVQRMVWADSAGVAFSVDPVTGRSDRLVVSASWGLGESVVAGTVNADTWTLDKDGLGVVEERVGDKERMTIPGEEGTSEVNVPRFLRSRPALTREELASVARMTLELEREQGWPVDVEFAWQGGRLALLQCRPVTAAGEPGREP